MFSPEHRSNSMGRLDNVEEMVSMDDMHLNYCYSGVLSALGLASHLRMLWLMVIESSVSTVLGLTTCLRSHERVVMVCVAPTAEILVELFELSLCLTDMNGDMAVVAATRPVDDYMMPMPLLTAEHSKPVVHMVHSFVRLGFAHNVHVAVPDYHTACCTTVASRVVEIRDMMHRTAVYIPHGNSAAGVHQMYRYIYESYCAANQR